MFDCKKWLVCSQLALFFTPLGFISCNDSNERKDKDALLVMIDSLQSQNDIQSHQLKDFSEYMAVISESLDSIAEQEDFIRINNRGIEGKSMTRTELKANLDMFAQLLKRQQNRIAELEDSVMQKGGGYDKLRNIISHLNQQLEEKNQRIANLQNMLNGKNADIRRLTQEVNNLTLSNAELSETISQQGDALVTQSQIINECYVKIGTKKELKDAGLLSGGFLSKKRLNLSNFASAGFAKVDIRSFTEVTIPSKNAQILTQMPSSSYRMTITDGQTTIEVLDPTTFWSISNYLVILIK